MSEFKYWAFISYSHQDKKWGDWLHKALETYRIPKRLVGTKGRETTVPKRLYPVFIDRQELPGSANLGKNIEAALQSSRYLIVICTPRSAASRWVNEEIARYKAMGREDHILCLIVDGEPNATDKPGREAEECFPEAVRFGVDANGELTSQRVEPIAADLRMVGDRRKNAQLKLISGLLGINYDQLKQRDKTRQRWRVAWGVGGLFLLTFFVVSALGVIKNQYAHMEQLNLRAQSITIAHFFERAGRTLSEKLASKKQMDNTMNGPGPLPYFFKDSLARAINEGESKKALALLALNEDINRKIMVERQYFDGKNEISLFDIAVRSANLPVIDKLIEQIVAQNAQPESQAEVFDYILQHPETAYTRFLPALLNDKQFSDWLGNPENPKAQRLMMHALDAGLKDVVTTMVEKGVLVGEGELILAVKLGDVDSAALFIDHGISPVTRFPTLETVTGRRVDPDSHGGYLLHYAAYSGNSGMVLMLLAKGADINVRDYLGWTPLHWAVLAENPDIVFLLLERGATIDQSDYREQTPLQIAMDKIVAEYREYKSIDFSSRIVQDATNNPKTTVDH